MSLLDNAAQSIRLGLEDFSSEDSSRLLSAARNLHAGVLLLYKEKLRRLSPPDSEEVLLKQNIEPRIANNGKLIFVGKGKKTVDIQAIQSRFKTLGISADWKTLQEVTKVRNDIEHYYTTSGKDAVRGAISKAFILFRDFTRLELGEDPRVLLGDESWLELIQISEIFDQERAECSDAILRYEWTASELQEAAIGTSCKNCGSKLIEPKNDQRRPDVLCRSCGHWHDFEDFAAQAMAEGINHHSNYKDGGESIVVLCPHCAQETYHYEAGLCVSCEESVADECQMCSDRIPSDELEDDGLCGHCRHITTKDD